MVTVPNNDDDKRPKTNIYRRSEESQLMPEINYRRVVDCEHNSARRVERNEAYWKFRQTKLATKSCAINYYT